LFVNFSISGEVGDKLVPSLILIHFIENLFKHGIVNDEVNPAEINIVIEADSLSLQTKNKVVFSDTYMDSGIGGENMKRRLKAMFDDNYEVKYTNEDGQFESYVKLPL
jgi:two-component system LytT family sensor kinase